MGWLRVAAASLSIAGAAMTAGCDREAEPAATATPDRNGDLSIENARLILPAVGGNPGVVYFDLSNAGTKTYAVRTIAVEGAGRTEFHATMEMGGRMEMGETGPQTVEPGGTLSFEPGGLHAMVFDLAPALVPGSTTGMTLTLAGGNTVRFEVPVKSAGEAR